MRQHTELELKFTDPATSDLHPGVAGTIANGSNLFVEFPGYSDYRHISVIGKGVTFQLPHCPDLWGMMCEGDLEEVYRIRTIDWKLLRMQMWFVFGFMLLSAGGYLLLHAISATWAGASIMGIAALLYGGIGTRILQNNGSKPLSRHLGKINKFIRVNAEGRGDLTQRLNVQDFAGDETRELAKWINNMIDSVEGIMRLVKQAAGDVQVSQNQLSDSMGSTEQSAQRMSNKVHLMIRSLLDQLQDIDMVKDVSQNMSGTLRELEDKASGQIAVAQDEVARIGVKMNDISLKVEETNRTIQTFLQTTQEIPKLLQVIEEISTQTNLLSLNASIEAARVGEHGKGFAVVAGEIRKLAELTKKSTMEIKDTIEHIESHARIAFQSMAEGSKVVNEGTQIVAAASELLSDASAQENIKTQLVDEVVELMERVAAVSMENRQISADVENNVQELLRDILHVHYTTEHVGAITQSLLSLVNQFQLTEGRIR